MVGPQHAAKLKAVHPRHGDIADDKIGVFLLRDINTFNPFLSRENRITCLSKQAVHEPELFRDIVDDEDRVFVVSVRRLCSTHSSCTSKLQRWFWKLSLNYKSRH